MAIAASAIWRVRPGGSVLNGAVYDGTTYAGGTDYSQQDAAQLSLTDVVGNGTTTITSATAGFTSAMVGNAINITSGTGVTVGHYLIASFTNSMTVVLDRTPGTFAAGVGRVGGAWGGSTQHPFQIGDSVRAVGNKPVPGNTVYIRGAGTDTPSSADYTFSGYSALQAGDTTSGKINWLAENGRPRFHGNGLTLLNGNSNRIYGMYFYITSNATSGYGVISLNTSTLENCVVNTNSQSSMAGVVVGGSQSEVINCEVLSGTTSPTANVGSHGVVVNGAIGCKIFGNRIHHSRDIGINVTGGPSANITCNWIYGNVGDGVATNVTSYGDSVCGNTIHGNGGHGINIASLATLPIYTVFNNIFSGHTTASKNGVNVAAGTTAAVAAIRRFFDYNFYYNNTGHRSSNFAAGIASLDLTVDPYTNAAAFDFSLNATAGGGASVRAAGFPAVFGTYPITGLTRANYPDGGANQHIDPAASGGGISFFGGM